MTSQRGYSLLLWLAIAIGTILQISSLRGARAVDAGTVFLFVWGMAPYLVLLALPRLTKGRGEVIAAVIATVIPDFVLRLEVQSSKSSTAVLALLTIPFWILVLFIPLGVYGVRAMLWLRRRSHG